MSEQKKLSDKLRDDIGPEDFGVPAEFCKAALNFANWIGAQKISYQCPAPIPEQVAQASSIEGLEVLDWTRDGMIDGTEFVRLDDVRPLLATQSAKQGAQVQMLRDAIAKQLDPAWECRSPHPALYAALKATEDQASVKQATGAKEEIRNQALEEAAMMFQHGVGESWIAEAIRKLKSERIDRASTAGAESDDKTEDSPRVDEDWFFHPNDD